MTKESRKGKRKRVNELTNAMASADLNPAQRRASSAVSRSGSKSSTPASGVKLALTRRARIAAGRGSAGAPDAYGDGTWTTIKPGFTIPEGSWIHICKALTEAYAKLDPPILGGPKYVEARPDCFMIQNSSQEIMRRTLGIEVGVLGPNGQVKKTCIKEYYVQGPRSFVTKYTGALSTETIARKIAEAVPRAFFVMDEQRMGNTLGPAKRILFADPPGFSKIELNFGSLKVRFWAENPNERCTFVVISDEEEEDGTSQRPFMLED